MCLCGHMTDHTAKANLENGFSWPLEAIPCGVSVKLVKDCFFFWIRIRDPDFGSRSGSEKLPRNGYLKAKRWLHKTIMFSQKVTINHAALSVQSWFMIKMDWNSCDKIIGNIFKVEPILDPSQIRQNQIFL